MTNPQVNREKLQAQIEVEKTSLHFEMLIANEQEIIDNAHRIVMFEEFKQLLENPDYASDEQVAELLTHDEPLEFLYQRWLKQDLDFTDTLRASLALSTGRE